MTWHYSIADDGSSMDIYDHNGNLHTTLTNDGSGFTIPTDIKQVMRETWEQEVSLGQSPVMNVRAGEILMHLVTDDIEEVTN